MLFGHIMSVVIALKIAASQDKESYLRRRQICLPCPYEMNGSHGPLEIELGGAMTNSASRMGRIATA